MFCFSVFTGNKQLRVYFYTAGDAGDRARALVLARALAAGLGGDASIEEFGLAGVGCRIV